MGYVDAFRAVESTYTEAIVLSQGKDINQSGVYLFFEGSVANNAVQDTLSFSVVVAANTYVGENGAMAKVDEIRLKALTCPFDIEFKRCRGVNFENSSLYLVACELTIQINIKD